MSNQQQHINKSKCLKELLNKRPLNRTPNDEKMWSLTEDYKIHYKKINIEIVNDYVYKLVNNYSIPKKGRVYYKLDFLMTIINKHYCSWEYEMEERALRRKLKDANDGIDELNHYLEETKKVKEGLKKKYENILRTIDCRTLSEGEYMDYAVMMKDDFKELKEALSKELKDNAYNKAIFKAKWNKAVDRIKELEAENKQLKKTELKDKIYHNDIELYTMLLHIDNMPSYELVVRSLKRANLDGLYKKYKDKNKYDKMYHIYLKFKKDKGGFLEDYARKELHKLVC